MKTACHYRRSRKNPSSARLPVERHRLSGPLRLDFSTSGPLETLGLTPREAEVLLWVSQGKSNPEISVILGTTGHTIKKHLQNIFAKLGIDTRNAATVIAFEKLLFTSFGAVR